MSTGLKLGVLTIRGEQICRQQDLILSLTWPRLRLIQLQMPVTRSDVMDWRSIGPGLIASVKGQQISAQRYYRADLSTRNCEAQQGNVNVQRVQCGHGLQ